MEFVEVRPLVGSMMRNLTTSISLVLVLSLLVNPVVADTTFDNLVKQRAALVQKVLAGNATDNDVAQINSLTNQIKNYTAQRVQSNADQQAAIINGLDRVDRQSAAVSSSLFNGSNNPAGAGSTGGYNIIVPDGNITSSDTVVPSSGSGGQVVTVPGSPIEIELQAGVAYNSVLTQEIDQAMLVAAKKAPPEVVAAVDKFNRPVQKVIAFSKEEFNEFIPYRGFGPSSEAADVILDEKLKLKSLSAAVYAQQKFIDETHLNITTAVLEMAQGLGENNPDSVKQGYDMLVNLTDTVEADKMKILLLGHVSDSPTAVNKLDVVARQKQYKDMLKAALEKDNVIKNIEDELRKYNHRNKNLVIASHIVPVILGAVSMVPAFVGPAAKGLLVTWTMATGGPEYAKILKELYLDKQLESRVSLLSNEILMEMSAQDSSANNPVLYWAATNLLEQ